MDQQQTQIQHAQEETTKRARKRLRDSCNSCALSKVKCSRDQPSCERCNDRGIYCAYSTSKRTGKRRATTSLCLPPASMMARSSQLSLGLSTPTEESFAYDIDFSEFDKANNLAASNINPQLLMDTSDPIKTPALSDSILPWDDPMFAAIMDNVSNNNSEFYSSRSIGSRNDTNNNQDTSYRNGGYIDNGAKSRDGSANSSDSSCPSDGYETHMHQKGLRQKANSLEDFFKSRFDIVAQTSQSSNTNNISTIQSCPSVSNRMYSPTGIPRDCMTVALDALQSLHQAQPTCTIACEGETTPQPNKTQTMEIDDVLAKNKEIIDAVATILKCSCSLDTQLALILTSIGLKIIAWYSAVARLDEEQDEPLASPPSKPVAERVSHMPIMVGKYHFDGDDRVRMRAQMALGELHRVVRLVEQLGQRFNAVGQNANINAEEEDNDNVPHETSDSQAVPALIGPMLVSFLRDRVRSAKSEASDILKKSQQISWVLG